MKLTTRDVERFYKVSLEVQEREPDLLEGATVNHQLWMLRARIAIEMGMVDEYQKGTDIDDIHPAIVTEIGREFSEAWDEANTIPKKNG